MNYGSTFFKTKMNFFMNLTDNEWRIKFMGSSPMLHTIREFTPEEQEDELNYGLKGVRTYFFSAHHWRGYPMMNLEESDYDDWAWVPKRQLNEYLLKDYYEIFIDIMSTR